jgi:hypothetical protein
MLQQVTKNQQDCSNETCNNGRVNAISRRLEPEPEMEVQHTIGNHGLLRRHGLPIQAKLKVSDPNDEYEQEADRVADVIVGITDLPASPPVYQARLFDSSRTSKPDQELEHRIQSIEGGGRPLSESARVFFEHRFGADFNNVRIHHDANADGLNRALNSHAFTSGQNIFISQGEYEPHCESGRKLLAHELTHVLHQSGDTKTLQPATATMIQKKDRVLAHATGEGEWVEYVPVQRRSIKQWQLFLKDADEYRAALELNVFLALATGYPDYIRTGDESYTINPPVEIEPPYPVIKAPKGPKAEPVVTTLRAIRREELSQVPRPSDAECTELMIAFLSTPNIDLREMGALSPVLGYLLPKFIKKYYEPAIQYMANKSGEVGGTKDWTIKPGAIDAFLGQAEGAFSDTRDLEETRTCGYACVKAGLPPTVEPSKLPEIGVSAAKAGEGPTTMLQAMAMAGAQGGALTALGAALDPSNKENAATIAERGDREIGHHARVLSGIVKRRKRIEALNESIIKIVANAVLAATGMGLTQKVFTEVLSRVGATFVVESIKQGVTTQAGTLAGLSESDLAANFKSSFTVTIQEHLNKIRAEKGVIPDKVGMVADSIKLAFLYESG